MKINFLVRASTVCPPVTIHQSGEPISSSPSGCRPNGFLLPAFNSVGLHSSSLVLRS